MLTLSGKTNKGPFKIESPERKEELSVEQYQKLFTDWDGVEWIPAFSILSGLQADYIEQSTHGGLEVAMYKSIEFLFGPEPFPFESFESLRVPETLTILSDSPVTVTVPKKIGRLSIGQAIQARRSLEGLNDLRSGISIITAIYLQPLIDNGKYDHLRAIEIERTILKMPITKIFPIGFFLLRKLNQRGNWFTNVLNLLKRKLIKNVLL